MFEEPSNKKRRIDSALSTISNFKNSHNNNHETNEDAFFYVYEAKKRNLKSNLKIDSNARLIMKGIRIDDDPKSYCLRPVYNRINLFDMCLRFVALNFDLVDSLIGFPSLIGEMLFSECVKCQKFNAKKEFKTVESHLNVFAQTYPDLLIESINLANKKLVLPNILVTISYCQIRRLDLSGCNLMSSFSNSSNLVDHLKSSSVYLEYLNLSDNNLDENFIKKFTLPQRLGYVNFDNLSTLDLRNNKSIKVSNSILKYFTKYERLNQIFCDAEKDLQLVKSTTFNYKNCSCDSFNLINLKVDNKGWINRVCLDDLVTLEQEKAESHQSSTQG
jgi:hypothetical protein